MNTKKYAYTYEQYDEENKNAQTMIEEILSDSELSVLDEIVIGYWGECWEEPVQPIIDGIVEHKEQFMHIQSLFIGDMQFDECEVSWIEQGNYEEMLRALPNLKSLTIKGSQGLKLGNVHHEQLETLEIICGGLPKEVLESIKNAYLPNLRKLNLYIGVEDYGFDGELKDILSILDNTSLGKLEYLGLGDSEIEDEIVKGVMEKDWPKTLKILDFSNGTLGDRGAESLLVHSNRLEGLELIDLTYNFLTPSMKEKLSKLPVTVITEDTQEEYHYDDDDDYDSRYPMLTE